MEIVESNVILNKIRFHASIGVSEQEKKVGNDYLLSVRIRYPFTEALLTDKVEDTLSYADVYELCMAVLSKPYNLLEKAAGEIGKKLFEKYEKIDEIYIKLLKINPPMGGEMDNAGIELHLINNKTR